MADKITIPAEALIAGYAAWWNCIRSGSMNERALSVAFLAMLEAWPGMQRRYHIEQAIILPLTQEPRDDRE